MHKPRARLTEPEAIAIFKLKGTSISATSLGRAYTVSEKAVRDIWKGRTWAKETWHLDMNRPLHIKKIGRPAGRKDSKPRASPGAVSSAELKKRSHGRAEISCETNKESVTSAAVETESMNTACVKYPYLRTPSFKNTTEDVDKLFASVEIKPLDDVLWDWERNPQDIDEPFASDWALALLNLALLSVPSAG